jgi:group I intron endonuclease
VIIYKLTNIVNGKEYVGQTIHTVEERWKEHVAESKIKRSNDRLLCKAIRKYGEDNFVKTVIDTASSLEELNKKEQEWIATLNTFRFGGGNGYNMNIGGGSNSGYKQTEEVIRKKVKKQSRPIICIETGNVYTSSVEAAKAIGVSYGLINNVVNGRKDTAKGLHFESLDLETKEKANSRKQKREKITTKRFTFGRPVICLNTDEEFSSVKEAARKLGVAENNMTFHLQGKQRTMKGMIFKYKDELVKGEAECLNI